MFETVVIGEMTSCLLDRLHRLSSAAASTEVLREPRNPLWQVVKSIRAAKSKNADNRGRSGLVAARNLRLRAKCESRGRQLVPKGTLRMKLLKLLLNFPALPRFS